MAVVARSSSSSSSRARTLGAGLRQAGQVGRRHLRPWRDANATGRALDRHAESPQLLNQPAKGGTHRITSSGSAVPAVLVCAMVSAAGVAVAGTSMTTGGRRRRDRGAGRVCAASRRAMASWRRVELIQLGVRGVAERQAGRRGMGQPVVAAARENVPRRDDRRPQVITAKRARHRGEGGINQLAQAILGRAADLRRSAAVNPAHSAAGNRGASTPSARGLRARGTATGHHREVAFHEVRAFMAAVLAHAGANSHRVRHPTIAWPRNRRHINRDHKPGGLA